MTRCINIASMLAAAIAVTACGGGGGGGGAPAQAPKAPVPAPASTVPSGSDKTFAEATAASGIDYEIGYSNFQTNGPNAMLAERSATGGVAAGDYDGDGDIDLFITRGDIGANLLYRNNGSGVFSDVAAAAGVAFTATATENYRHSGPTFADIDGDGDLDLFIGGLFGDPSLVYRNNGDGSFSDVTAGSGIDLLDARYTISAAFGDYDLDGDLDLLLAHWGTVYNSASPGDTEHLWRNDSGNGAIRFTSVSESAGIAPAILPAHNSEVAEIVTDWSFTPTFARIDADPYPDLMSVADFGVSRFFRNNGDGSFANATDPAVITDLNGMGSALGDFDNDGDLDWFVTAIYRPGEEDSGNRLYRNDGGVFSDRTTDLNVRDGGWGWGACFIDFENDGDLDIYHTNGFDTEEDFSLDESVAFIGSGGGPFLSGAAVLGLNDSHDGRGIVCADFDDDGDVDILQLHRSKPVSASLWRNDTSGNNYLKVKLRGLAPNTEAAGARIYLTVNGVTQMREITIGSNYVSQNPTVQVFGLGTATAVQALRVEWPPRVPAAGAGPLGVDDSLVTTTAVSTAIGIPGRTLLVCHPDLSPAPGDCAATAD